VGTGVGVPFCATLGCEAELLLFWEGALFVFELEEVAFSPGAEQADRTNVSAPNNAYCFNIESFIAK
jgi:hypothetical protein